MRYIIYIWIYMTAHMTICFQVYIMDQKTRWLCVYDKKTILGCRHSWWSPQCEQSRLRILWLGSLKAPGGRPAKAKWDAYYSAPRTAIRQKTLSPDKTPITCWRNKHEIEAAEWWRWRRGFCWPALSGWTSIRRATS